MVARSASSVDIAAWSDIEDEFAGPGSKGGGGALLLGNGFSINIWSEFAYSTLLSRSGLTGDALMLFARRTNFETVLAELAITRRVLDVVSPEKAELTDHLEQLAEQVRDGLLAAVDQVHPERSALQAGRKRVGQFGFTPGVRVIQERVADFLPRYSSIFTTNYDLLSYWASVEARIADLLPGSDSFDLVRAEQWVRQEESKLYYLHGALHLWRNLSTNAEGKHTVGGANLLLDVIRDSVDDPQSVPLFISEGTSAQKVSRISASPYLTFCGRQLQKNADPLTVLGHSLDAVDQHICDAIQRHQDRKVAVGVWVGDVVDPEEQRKQRIASAIGLRARLRECSDIVFFNSADHPLTDPNLQCR